MCSREHHRLNPNKQSCQTQDLLNVIHSDSCPLECTNGKNDILLSSLHIISTNVGLVAYSIFPLTRPLLLPKSYLGQWCYCRLCWVTQPRYFPFPTPSDLHIAQTKCAHLTPDISDSQPHNFSRSQVACSRIRSHFLFLPAQKVSFSPLSVSIFHFLGFVFRLSDILS